VSVVLTDLSEGILTVTVNRPEKLNALNAEVIEALRGVFHEAKANSEVGALVLTGAGEKAFVAGADISGFPSLTPVDARDFARKGQAVLDLLETMGKPSIAAVNGFALGGGCELAMMCDMIIAGDSAKFGQPEIKLGVIPGMGGSQRLTRAVGKSKAMDLCLTGRNMDAEEAERAGLVARVVPSADLLDEAVKVAETIASMGKTAAVVAKQAVNRAFETTLEEGLLAEQNAFYALFATEDQTEGMTAFAEKRAPEWKR